MVEIKRNFLKGKMNKDIDERYLEDGDYSHAENIRVISPAEGNIGVVKNLPSSASVFTYQTGVGEINPECLSFAKDSISNKIYLFIHTSQKDVVYEHDTKTNINTLIIFSNIIGGVSVLNFGENQFAEAKVLDGFLIWTTGIDDTKKINIKKWKDKVESLRYPNICWGDKLDKNPT